MKTKDNIRILFAVILCISFTSINAQGTKHRKVQKKKYNKTHSHKPHYHYAKLPRWGSLLKETPKNAFAISHSGVKYHYHSGIFYKKSGAKYKIVKAPVGIRVRTLPSGNINFILGTRKYYYYYGTYYIKSDIDNEYVIVAAPQGARINALPEGYKQIVIKGKEYYEFEGVYYKAVLNEKNEEWYEITGDKS